MSLSNESDYTNKPCVSKLHTVSRNERLVLIRVKARYHLAKMTSVVFMLLVIRHLSKQAMWIFLLSIVTYM